MPRKSSRNTPNVINGELWNAGPWWNGTRLGGRDWLAWLHQASSFYFHFGPSGFTARKEHRFKADYWYAYKKIDGVLKKAYIGPPAAVTVDRLTEVARFLSAAMGELVETA